MAGLAQIVGGFAANESARLEAEFLRNIGRIEAADKRRDTRRLLASQTVAFAASGVDPGQGTPLDVLGDTVAESELAALRIQFRRDFEAQSIKRQGQQAFTQGIIGGSSKTLLGVQRRFGNQ